MSDEYQLRKDIDRLIRDVYDLSSGALRLATTDEFDKLVDRLNSDNSLDMLEANLSTFSESLDGYVDSLESFEEQLEDYGGELTEFGGQLTDYGGQLTTFSGQLSSYGGQLTNFSGQLSSYGTQLSGFNTTLNGYKSRLDDFDDALNDESTGFITTLSTLKTYIYGYDPNNPSAHSYSNPTSDSLKGMTNTLQQLVRDLQTGDGVVLENLGRLKDHIQAFSGSLQQFKTYLAQQGVDVSTLNDDVISLILELNKSIDTISDHQDMLEEAQEIIGEPSTATTEATGMFKRLEDGEEVMENVSTQADAIDVIVRGDPQVQGDTGLQGATTVLQGAVGDENSGLIKLTNDLNDTVGDEDSGLIKLTNDLNDTVGDEDSGLIKLTNDLNDTVGDEDSGLIKKTNDLDDAVGDENTGLIAQTNDIIDTIGEPAQGQQLATGLHLLIDNAQETANAVDGAVELVKGKIGYNQIGNTSLQSQITTQNGKIGNVPTGSTLQGQITAQGNKIGTVPTGQTLQGQITANTGDISDIQGDIGTVPSGKTLQGQITYIETNSQYTYKLGFYKPITNQQGVITNITPFTTPIKYGDWVIVLIEVKKLNQIVSNLSSTISVTITPQYGQSSTVSNLSYETYGSYKGYICGFQVQGTGLYTISCDYATANFYIDDWITKDLISDYNSQPHSGGDLTGICNLYINPNLKLCELYFEKSFNSGSADTTNTWYTGLVPSDYRPSHAVMGALNYAGSIYVTDGGTVGGRLANAFSSSRTLKGTVMWHY